MAVEAIRAPPYGVAVYSGWATAFWKKGEPIRGKQLTSAFQEHTVTGLW